MKKLSSQVTKANGFTVFRLYPNRLFQTIYPILMDMKDTKYGV